MAVDIWNLKHFPTKLDEYIFQNDHHRDVVTKIIEDKSFDSLLLTGVPGTGKTSLAYLLKNELGLDDSDFLHINASKDTGKSLIEEKISAFASSMAMSGDFKIILLDEADRLSAQAQDSLKAIIDQYALNARFIITSNHPRKIIDALHSRCFEIKYEAIDKDEMLMRFATILKKEKVKVPSVELLDEYVENEYPDFRHLLKVAQMSIKDGVLQPYPDTSSDVTEVMVGVLDLFEADDWAGMRTFLAANISDDKWEDCYRFLYEYLHDIGKFKGNTKNWKAGIVILSDHLYRHSMVADPELNFASCLIRLSDI
jgi:DNA polymerase III delta prime subunit